MWFLSVAVCVSLSLRYFFLEETLQLGLSACKIWYFDHIITVDWVSVQFYEAQQDYNNVSLSFKAWWSHHRLSIASGTELKHMKCVQMLDWHHKHSPSPHTVCLISLNQEESVQHVAFSAWWCQSFQGFSGSLYKRVSSEKETIGMKQMQFQWKYTLCLLV